MVATESTQGQWHELKQLLKNRWRQLTEEDFRSFDGNMELLAGTIQQKTGEARETINSVLRSVFEQGTSQFERALEATRECSAGAADAVHQTYDRVAETVRTGYREAEDIVRQRPAGSVAVAFGAGILTGLIVGLMTRNR